MSQRQERRGRGRPQTLDRQRLIELAMASYWCEGVCHVSMNELCRRADVSKPGVYREFGSEDGLMDAALAHYHATVIAPLIALLDSARPFDEILEHLLRFSTAPAEQPPGCLLADLRGAPERPGALTAARVEAMTRALREAYGRWFSQAQARGEVDAALELELATHFIDTQLTTVATQMALGVDPLLTRAQAELAFRALRVDTRRHHPGALEQDPTGAT